MNRSVVTPHWTAWWRSHRAPSRWTAGSGCLRGSGRGGKRGTRATSGGLAAALAQLQPDQEAVGQHHRDGMPVEARPQPPLGLVPPQFPVGFLMGEYCLCNHLKGENLSDVAVDPEPGKQRHGKVHHDLGLGDDNGLPFEAPKPMALAAMIPLDCIRVGFAHDESLGWDHRSIYLPMIGTVERDIP
jgi:hypothetical protein